MQSGSTNDSFHWCRIVIRHFGGNLFAYFSRWLWVRFKTLFMWFRIFSVKQIIWIKLRRNWTVIGLMHRFWFLLLLTELQLCIKKGLSLTNWSLKTHEINKLLKTCSLICSIFCFSEGTLFYVLWRNAKYTRSLCSFIFLVIFYNS